MHNAAAVIYLLVLLFEFTGPFDLRKEDNTWTDLLNWYRNLRGSGYKSVKTSSKIAEFEEKSFFGEYEYADDTDAANIGNQWWSEGKRQSTEEDIKVLWNDLLGRKNLISARKISTFEDEEKTILGASLAFVFDSTGSMGDELNHVKSGAMKILAALRDHPNAPIYNYIWVPFNDPSIGPITVTTDPKLFEERMNQVLATGGGDCPEMSLGAIKTALDSSLPNSYVYVFTDAPPKDSNLLNEVLSLVQRKQAQVVFIITDGCLNTEYENYWVYERIAHTSSGQIYNLTTDEVKEVLKYVKVALQPHTVSLVSLNKPAPNQNHVDKINVIIDDSLEQFTISVSGTNAKINVSDPKGVQINGPPRLENVLNLANIKVVKVKEPDPGAWSVLIKSDSGYTVRSTGLSKLNFNHGFSTKESFDLKETNYRPLKGAKSFVLIQTSDAEEVFNITTLDFIALSGTVLKSIPLESIEGKNSLYKAGNFVAPNDFFYLEVSGFGKDGLPIRRITSTAISAQLPEKPIVVMKTKVLGRVNRPGKISCRVESVVPVTVRWYRNGNYLKKEQNCSETCEVDLQFDKYLPEMEGKYFCQAKNIAGIGSQELFLTVLGDPPLVTVTTPVIASLGQKVLLNCSVESQLPYNVTWTQFTLTNLHSGVLHPSFAGVKLNNNSLLIEAVRAEDEGWYVCAASNNAGESQEKVLLMIKEPVTVKVEPTAIAFSKGDSARVFCFASGKPQPRIEWMKNQYPIKDPTIIIEDMKENLNLVIDYLEEKHAGNYTCNAINPEESASATVRFVYKESPNVKAKENGLMVKEGSEAILTCLATGTPKPIIRWFKGNNELKDYNERFQVTENTLVIKSTDVSDFGEYSCVAENDQGTSVDHIALTIGLEPTFLQKPRNREIQLNHSGTISCSAFGVPLPEIKWTRTDGREMNKTRISILPTGALKITKMAYEDGGRYICTAENVFGSVSHEISIKASGAVPPSEDNSRRYPSEIKAISGNELVIPCGIHLGNPPARITWFRDGFKLSPKELEFFVKDTGTLVIPNATTYATGNFLCEAENALGSSSRSFDVFISESPTILMPNNTELKGRIGGVIVIPCLADGHPLPTITWKKNGLSLPMSATIFQNENGSLIIKNLSEENSGVYVCTATNAVGSVSQETSIQVQVPPSFTDEMDDYPVIVVEGHMVVLNCNVSATPEPNIEWFKDGEPFIIGENSSKILRFFATIDHTGNFKCVVTNDAGSDFREFNVTILVPPKIHGREDEKSIQAITGTPITLTCNVTGVPAPTILWQRNGMYLTQNTSEETILEDGSLVITNVTKKSAGAYTCDAENLGGISQRTYYLQINYPPSFVNIVNETTSITLTEGTEEYSLHCLVEGNPKPSITWKKNGFPINEDESGLSILKDNTLVFILVSKEMTGTYRCEVSNSQGSAIKDFEIKVLTPLPVSNNINPTKLEVNEGDSLTLRCPTMLDSPPQNIRWIKDGKHLDSLFRERSDEVQMKLSPDQKTLVIVEAHPIDRGNYSCIATSAAGRTDAEFFVDVLMTPHFEEFNHVAHRTILTGGEVILNCSVSGNPPPKVFWRKENTSITPYKIPGVYVTLDKRHLKIMNGKVDHTGTYVCLATNKVNTKEREFYVTVLDPPQIFGSLQQTISILKGNNVTLDCQSTGNPNPTFVWIKETDTKIILNVTKNTLKINNAKCEDTGRYLCEVTNSAGTRTRYFDVNVLERQSLSDKNITMKCKPGTAWLSNGRTINRKKKMASYNVTNFDDLVFLKFNDQKSENYSRYTLIASNKSGIIENNLQVQLLGDHSLSYPSQKIIVNLREEFTLNCLTFGDPPPQRVTWYKDGKKLEGKKSIGSTMVFGNFYLKILDSRLEDGGHYKCVAGKNFGRKQINFYVEVVVTGRWSQWSEWSSCSVSCGAGHHTRTRTCEGETIYNELKLKIDQKALHCTGDSVDKKNCFEICQNNSSEESSLCSNKCDSEIRKRCTMSETDFDETLNKTKCEEACTDENCPINGQWSEWSVWSACTRSGIMQRSRKCDSPSPRNGGKSCLGRRRQIKLCKENSCKEQGKWSPWSEWSSCFSFRGSARRKRMRKCHPSKCGRLCLGSNYQLKKCSLELDSNKSFPTSADIQVKGSVNGHQINERMDVQIINLKNESKLLTSLDPKFQEKNLLPYMPLLLFPVSWNTAYETDDANNGLSLTGGNFTSESDILFSTGEEFTMKHKGEGINENGTFLVEIEVIGEVPLVQPQAIVAIDPMEQDLVQTSPSTLYAFTQNSMTVKNRNFSYLWNNTIGYKADNKIMPYLVEKLTINNISNTYDPSDNTIEFTAHSSIGKKFLDKKCPIGFSPNSKFMHCQDVDECSMKAAVCENDKICENTFGSYKCVCQTGYKMAEGRCLDIDECSKGFEICSHFCHNTPGSYMCFCPYGYYLGENRRDCLEISNSLDILIRSIYRKKQMNSTLFDGYSDNDKHLEHRAETRISCPPGHIFKNNGCQDYNECENFQNICDVDETCVNLPGSFKCESTPCPVNYDRINSNRHCVKICSTKRKCTRGATVSESKIFFSVSLNRDNILPLDKVGLPDCNVVKTRYRLMNPKRLFQIIQHESRHFLRPKTKLLKNNIYRIEVEVFSYGSRNELLYFIELIIFLIMN